MSPGFSLRLRLCTTAVCVSAIAGAQGTSEPDDCSEAAATVRSAHPTRESLRIVGHCARSGGEALAALWASGTVLGDSAVRRSAIAASLRLVDGRVYPVVRSTAESRQFETSVRLAALAVLVTYVDSNANVSEAWLRAPRPSGLMISGDGMFPGFGSHRSRSEPAVPPPSPPYDEVAQLLLRLRTDADPVVANAALRLRQTFAARNPRVAPLDPDAIQLVAGCRMTYQVRSKADIAVPIRVQLEGTTKGRDLLLDAGDAPKPNSPAGWAPPGTLVVLYGGQEIARLANRNGPCPGK